MRPTSAGPGSRSTSSTHARPRRLTARGAEVRLGARVERIGPPSGGRREVSIAGAPPIGADAVIVATDHERAADLVPADAGLDGGALRALGRRRSSISTSRSIARCSTCRFSRSCVSSPVDLRSDRHLGPRERSDAGGLALRRGRIPGRQAERPSRTPSCPSSRVSCRPAAEPRSRISARCASLRRPSGRDPGPGSCRPRPGRLAPGLFLARRVDRHGVAGDHGRCGSQRRRGGARGAGFSFGLATFFGGRMRKCASAGRCACAPRGVRVAPAPQKRSECRRRDSHPARLGSARGLRRSSLVRRGGRRAALLARSGAALRVEVGL